MISGNWDRTHIYSDRCFTSCNPEGLDDKLTRYPENRTFKVMASSGNLQPATITIKAE